MRLFGTMNPENYRFYAPADAGGSGDSDDLGNPNSGNVSDSNHSGNPADTSGAGAADANKPKQYTYAEDRNDWVPRKDFQRRLTETEKRAAEKATKEVESRYQHEISERDARIRALAGVDPLDPQKAEDEKVLAELKRMGVHTLTQEQFDEVTKLLSKKDELEASSRMVHDRHAEGMMVQAESELAEAMGVQKLSTRQIRQIRQAYGDAAEAAVIARYNDPDHDASTDFLARHDKGDKFLVKELVEEFLKDWEPLRRSAARDVTTRNRPLPNSGRGNPVIQSGKKIDLSKPGAFEDALAAARRDEGRGYRE